MTGALFDRMEETWALALSEKREPLRWRLNEAAWDELRRDERLYCNEPPRAGRTMRLLGVPVTIIDDRQSVPSFFLNAESQR